MNSSKRGSVYGFKLQSLDLVSTVRYKVAHSRERLSVSPQETAQGLHFSRCTPPEWKGHVFWTCIQFQVVPGSTLVHLFQGFKFMVVYIFFSVNCRTLGIKGAMCTSGGWVLKDHNNGWNGDNGMASNHLFDAIPPIPLQPLLRALTPQLRCHQPPVMCTLVSKCTPPERVKRALTDMEFSPPPATGH